MEEKESPLDREEFKLITPNERKFIENPTDFIKEYKSPDAMSRQYNNRIKYRAINAIRELAWLCDKLAENQLNKIFSEEHIRDIFKILDKALLIAAKRKPEIKKIAWHREEGIVEEDTLVSTLPTDELQTCMKKWMQYIMPADHQEAHEALKKEYFNNPMILKKKLDDLNIRIGTCLQENKKLVEFIEEKGLKKEYEARKTQEDSHEIREALRTAGWTDEKINEFLEKRASKL